MTIATDHTCITLDPEIIQPGRRLHTYLHRCTKCGNPNGYTIIHVRIEAEGTFLALNWCGSGNRLCPDCQAKYLPLTHGMRRELDRLSRKAWRDLRKRGCPFCQAGLDWYPTATAH